MNFPESESSFSAVSRLPIAPFSAFLNDLVRPIFLDNIQPSAELILVNANFPPVRAPETIPPRLFENCTFDLNTIVLNQVPNMEISHEYDDFMTKILHQCYETYACVQNQDQPSNIMTVSEPNLASSQTAISHSMKNETCTVTSLKIKLNQSHVDGQSECGDVLSKLINEDSFVNPLCFDCEEDLNLIAQVIRSLISTKYHHQKQHLEALDFISPLMSSHIHDVFENLEHSTEPLEPLKSLYCLSLIALLNINRASFLKETLKDFNSFDQVIKLTSYCKADGYDLMLSLVIESYICVLNRFKIQDSDISLCLSYLIDLCYDIPTGPLSKSSATICLSLIYAKYPDFSKFLIDQALMRSVDSEEVEGQKIGVTVILSCLQALSVGSSDNINSKISSTLSTCLQYLWKGDGNGNESIKGLATFSTLIEVIQVLYLNSNWPIAAVIMNFCTVQMFHSILKDDSSPNGKGKLTMKLKFMDILSSTAGLISSSQAVKKTLHSVWQLIEVSPSFQNVLSPITCLQNTSSGSDIKSDDTLTEESYINRINILLGKVPERVTGLLIKLISSEIVQIRSKAIKNLFALMNSSQMSESNYLALKKNILIKSADPSISVRDAVLEFISKLIFTSPSNSKIHSLSSDNKEDLIENVLFRLRDRGVSVRKRAVKIIGESLQKNEGSSMRIRCISHLILHSSNEEDEGVSEIIYKTLKDQWILNRITSQRNQTLSTLTPPPFSHNSFANEIIQLICNSEKGGMNAFQVFLSRLLNDSSIVNYEISTFFATTVNVLLENLLQALEKNDFKELKFLLESICLFSESTPKILESHLCLLQSLLRCEDGEVAYMAIKLISDIVPSASLTELRKLGEFEKDLLGIIYRGSEMSVKLGIETLYTYVNNCSHQYSTLSQLWMKFFEYLKGRQDELERITMPQEREDLLVKSNSIPHICRALLAIGTLCSQSALHREREFGSKDFHSSLQVRNLLDILSFYFSQSVNFIRSCSIQAFGSVLLTCPQISISSKNSVRSFISSSFSDPDEGCKLQILHIFERMSKTFQSTEKVNISTTSILSSSNNNNTTADISSILLMEGKESFYSALIQEYLQDICVCLIKDRKCLEIQAVALKISSTAAIMGLVNPKLIIPYVVTGMSSQNDQIQDFSKNSFDRIIARFPSLVTKDVILEVCHLLFLYSGDDDNVGWKFVVNDSAANQITTDNTSTSSKLSYYYSCIRNSKSGNGSKHCLDALNNIFTLFERIISGEDVGGLKYASTSKLQQGQGQLKLLEHNKHEQSTLQKNKEIEFIFSLLATLPFETVEEVQFCLHKAQHLFSISVDYCVSDESAKRMFTVLDCLRYTVDYLIKSYPMTTAIAIPTDLTTSAASLTNSGSISISKRTANNIYNYKKDYDSEKIEDLSKEFVLDFISKQRSVPMLILEQQQQSQAASVKKRILSSHTAHLSDDEEEEEISNFLIEDEDSSASVSASESSDDLSEEEFEKMLNQFNCERIKSKNLKDTNTKVKEKVNKVNKSKNRTKSKSKSKTSVKNQDKTHRNIKKSKLNT